MPPSLTQIAHISKISAPLQKSNSVCVHMKILVAEDDVPLAEFLSQRLQHEQFAVQIAATAPQAHRLAADQPFDLVLLDLNLEGTGGLEVLRNIRARRPDLPVMLMTGSAALEDRIRALDAGADDYV